MHGATDFIKSISLKNIGDSLNSFRNNIAQNMLDGKKDCYVITATESMANAFKDKNTFTKNAAELSAVLSKRVDGVSTIQNRMFKEWGERESLEDRLTTYKKINDYLDKISFSECDKALIESFRKNKAEVVKAIRLLVESDIFPSELPEDKDIIKYFKQIWYSIESDTTLALSRRIIRFRYQIASRYSRYKERNTTTQMNFLNNLPKGSKIYLIGFYFITPIQMRIFEIFQSNGYQVVFCSVNSDELDYDIWTKTEKLWWNQSLKKVTLDSSTLIDFVRSSVPYRHIDVTEYETESKFAEHIGEILEFEEGTFTNKIKSPDSCSIYTANSQRLTNLLKKYYPLTLDKKHLLSFPIGQYISNIFTLLPDNVTDSIGKSRNILFDTIYRLFQTGWIRITLNDKYYNSRDYAHKLYTIRFLFERARTFEDWERILSEAKLKIRKIEESADVYKNKGPAYLSFPPYNLSYTDIMIITALFSSIKDNTRLIGKFQKERPLKEQFSLIQRLVNDKYKQITSEDKDEDIFKEINERLHEYSDLPVSMQDIRDELQSIFSGRDEEDEEKKIDKQNIFKKVGDIEVEELGSNKKKDIYLVYADENSFPSPAGQLPWPLTNEMLDNISENLTESRKDAELYLKALKFRNDNATLSSRYLLQSILNSCTLNNYNLHIEWVSQKQDKKVAVSPYFETLVNTAYFKKASEYLNAEDELNTFFGNLRDTHTSKKEELCLPEKGKFNITPKTIRTKKINNKDKKYTKFLYDNFSSILFYNFVLNKQPFYADRDKINFLLSDFLTWNFNKKVYCKDNEVWREAVEKLQNFFPANTFSISEINDLLEYKIPDPVLRYTSSKPNGSYENILSKYFLADLGQAFSTEIKIDHLLIK